MACNATSTARRDTLSESRKRVGGWPKFPGDYASLQLPRGAVLGLHVPHDGHVHRVETAGLEIGFLVEDVDATHAELSTSGVRFLRSPTDMS
jgi:hypothetical protein